MTIELGKSKCVLSVTLTDITEGTNYVLFHRENRACSFTEDIEYKDFIITLRIDWRDIQDGDPTLDADIYRILADGSRKKYKNGRKTWHHTSLTSVTEGNPRCYEFKFEDIMMRLLARKVFVSKASLSVYVVDPDY